ncbi:hypothetical protein Tco_1162002, partial [Tanacetum coccineum]
RKAHLLEDKQIPSVGVFDEVFSIWKAFRGNTRDLGHFEKKRRDYDLQPTSLKIMFSEAGDGAKYTRDVVTIHLTMVSQEFTTASAHTTHPKI